MAALVWDQVGEKLYELGVDQGVLYPQNADGTYANGVAWNGLVKVTEKPNGADVKDMYADNIKYASFRAAEKFGATIEAYMYPEEFAECDGSKAAATGVYVGQQARKPFGFSYRTKIGNDTATESDDGYKIHLIYNATVSPSERSYQTINDSPEGITFSWEMNTIPVPVTNHKPTSCIIIDSTKVDSTKLTNFLKTLYGDTNGSATLPTPDQVIAAFTGNG